MGGGEKRKIGTEGGEGGGALEEGRVGRRGEAGVGQGWSSLEHGIGKQGGLWW